MQTKCGQLNVDTWVGWRL